MKKINQVTMQDELDRCRFQINVLQERLQHLTSRLREYKKVEEYNIRTVDSLENSERRYRMVVEDQTEFICRFLRDYTLTFVNEAYCHYFGKPRGQIIGKSFIPIVPPRDRKMIKEGIASLCMDKPAIFYDQQIKYPGGEIRWQHWTNRAVFDKTGRIVEYQAIGRDITERKEVEIALKKSEQGLLKQKNQLEKKNIALHEILGQIEVEKRNIKEDILHNINESLLPLVNKIRIERGTAQEEYIRLLEARLETISSSLGRKMASLHGILSKRELEVCNLISDGLTTKEIAALLYISLKTAETHRNNIRKKLDLTNKKVNLFSYLQS